MEDLKIGGFGELCFENVLPLLIHRWSAVVLALGDEDEDGGGR